MQPNHFTMRQPGARRIVRIGHHHHPGSRSHPCQQVVDTDPEIRILYGNRHGIVGEGVVAELGVAVGAVQQFVPDPEIGPAQAGQQFVGPRTANDAVRIDALPSRYGLLQLACPLLGVELHPVHRLFRDIDDTWSRAEGAFIGAELDGFAGKPRRQCRHVGPDIGDTPLCGGWNHVNRAASTSSATWKTYSPRWTMAGV